MKRWFMVLAIMLVATQGVAGIKDTKHDLSATSASGGITSDYDELCVFCHTPHKAIDNSNAPLWNRDLTGITISDYYNSATLDTVSQPTQVTAAVAASDVLLCLSCHDGSSLGNDLNNRPNSETAAPVLTGGTNGDGTLSADANIGVDLHDDHPIGMVYNTVYSNTTTEFYAPTQSGSTWKVSTLNLYDTTGVMWCSSCHDVHDNTYSPFLATSNAQSLLCLTCHNK